MHLLRMAQTTVVSSYKTHHMRLCHVNMSVHSLRCWRSLPTAEAERGADDGRLLQDGALEPLPRAAARVATLCTQMRMLESNPLGARPAYFEEIGLHRAAAAESSKPSRFLAACTDPSARPGGLHAVNVATRGTQCRYVPWRSGCVVLRGRPGTRCARCGARSAPRAPRWGCTCCRACMGAQAVTGCTEP